MYIPLSERIHDSITNGGHTDVVHTEDAGTLGYKRVHRQVRLAHLVCSIAVTLGKPDVGKPIAPDAINAVPITKIKG